MKKIISLILVLAMAISLTVIVPAFAMSDDGSYYKYDSTWKLSVNSFLSGCPIENAFDGDVNTFWHSKYTAEGSTITWKEEGPFKITVVFPEAVPISGFKYTPRNTASQSGRALQYNFYIAKDETSEPILAMGGDFTDDANPKSVSLPCNVTVKKVVFEITKGVNGYGTMAELNFMVRDASKEDVTVDGFKAYKESHTYYAIDRKDFKANAVSIWDSGHDASRIFDGNKGTFWHEKPGDSAPIILEVDMGKEYDIAAFSYFPRQDDPSVKCHWKTYNLYSSTDGTNYVPVISGGTMVVNFNEKNVFFKNPVKARYFKFEITEFNIHCGCAELNFYQTKEAKASSDLALYEQYVMQIGSNEMKVTKGGETAKTVTLDVAPYLDNGTTMIPLRGLLAEMGADIAWDGNNQSIVVNKGATKLELQVMNPRVFVTDSVYGRVRYTLKGSSPKIKSSRTFIPLRFVSENLGYNIAWDQSTQTITITYSKETNAVAE
ncbi:MAG: discoidin domain-containing protein [Bacillota bacterium]|nr:discoidin domain-containing protein [Bacillota bacterium]